MSRKVKVKGLANAVAKTLNEYSEFVSAEEKKAIKKIGREAAKELQEKAPRKTGGYAKSWKSKTTSETANTIHVSVYADKGKYRLTHLLENGHAKRGGGRVPPVVHIAPVNDEVADKIAKELKKSL